MVGHGPSLQQGRRGKEIDDHDKVVRQKRSKPLLKFPKQYGSRTDYACYSWKLVQIEEIDLPAREFWAFIDSRFAKLPDEEIEAMQAKFRKWKKRDLKVNREACNHWNEIYRELRTPFYLLPQMTRTPWSDDLGHLHMSAGTHAIICACEFLKPKEIVLAGYDSVVSGEWTWSGTHGPKWEHYPDHRFDVEKRMLPMIAEHYDVEIRPL